MIRLLTHRRERRRLAVLQARHELVSLPHVRWQNEVSECRAHARLQVIAATVDRALRRLQSSSADALAFKYAHARLTAFLQGWGDADLIAPTELPEMYQSLVTALHKLARRLAEEDERRQARPANPSSIVTTPPSPARTAGSHTSLLSGPRVSTASRHRFRGGRGARACPTTNQPGDHEQPVNPNTYRQSRSAHSARGRRR